MRPGILLTAALILASASPGFADDKKPDDSKWMVGKWKVVEATVNGEVAKDAPSFVVESKRFGRTEDSLFYNLPKELFPWNDRDVTDIALTPNRNRSKSASVSTSEENATTSQVSTTLTATGWRCA